MPEFHNDKTSATDAVGISVSDAKLRRLHPELFGWRSLFVRHPWGGRTLGARQTRAMLAEHMSLGDSRAALVIRVDPLLLVAAYTDEMDCASVLYFPSWLVGEYQLKPGSQLLTVNTYNRRRTLQSDLFEGPASYHRWTSYYPIIAEFVSADLPAIHARKRLIPPLEWQRTAQIARQRLAQGDSMPVRHGRPLYSGRDGKPIAALAVRPPA